jgi:hypothetical protein
MTTAGALGLVYCDFEEVAIGRRSRAPISDTPLDIPAVVVRSEAAFVLLFWLTAVNGRFSATSYIIFVQISTPDYFMLLEVAKTAPFITLEITPGITFGIHS